MKRSVPALLLCLMLGCGRSETDAPTDTGARSAVRTYFEALMKRDWPAAYAVIHPDAAKAWTLPEFTRRGEAYRARWGFDASEVHVRTCEERGEDASARMELAGKSAGRHQYKDALTLKRVDGQWRVVLSNRFGQK